MMGLLGIVLLALLAILVTWLSRRSP